MFLVLMVLDVDILCNCMQLYAIVCNSKPMDQHEISVSLKPQNQRFSSPKRSGMGGAIQMIV